MTKKNSTHRLFGLVALAAAFIFVVAACSTSDPDPTATAIPAAAPTSAPVPTTAPAPTAIPIVGSGVVGGSADFDSETMVSQGYWLSRDQFGPFVMGSGMGIPFAPPMEQVGMAIQMIAQNENDQVVVPTNMMPLQAVFASASPKLINDPRDFDPMDFEGLRLDPGTFDKTVRVRGQAETMLKESQWAHNFATRHFGKPTDDFGAQQRFMGMMVAMLAQMKGQYAMQNLMGEDGLYHDSDGATDYTANWVMLHALSDIAGLTGDTSGRYANAESHPMFEGAATGLLNMLESRQPQGAREAAAAIRALAYRASTATDTTVRDQALAKAASVTDGTLVGLSTSADVVEISAAIAGLTSAAIATGDDKYKDSADKLFATLAQDFDGSLGIFKSKTVYSEDDIAWIIGGLNFLGQRGNNDTKKAAKATLLAFYESAVSMSGLQLSAPPGKNGAMAGAWELDLPSVLYYHPENTPPPPMAGALTVPAEIVTWDGSAWSVTSDRFVPGSAMHLANELNWLGPHLGSVPFPPITR